MFISQQYNHIFGMSGEYWDVMIDILYVPSRMTRSEYSDLIFAYTGL